MDFDELLSGLKPINIMENDDGELSVKSAVVLQRRLSLGN